MFIFSEFLEDVARVDLLKDVFEVRRSKDTRNNCYFSLANSLDHKYYYMLADSETEDMFLSDCTLDCKDLEDTLIEIDKQIS